MDETARTAHLPLDTTADADAVQLDAYRRLGGTGRVAIVFRLNALVRAMTAAGIQRRHPTYDTEHVHSALLRVLLGDDLTRRAYPQQSLVDP